MVQRATEARSLVREWEALDALPLLAWASDAGGAVTFVNRHLLDFTGLSESELLGFAFVSALHPDDHERVLERWERAQESGDPYIVEERVRAADGSYRWFLAQAHPSHDEHGRIAGWIGAATDISERKLAEERAGYLLEVTAALAGATSLEATLAVALAEGLKAIGARSGAIAFLDAAGETLEVVHSIGYDAALIEQWRRFPLGSATPLAVAVRSGEAVWLESPEAWEGYDPALRTASSLGASRAWAALPLRVDGRSHGAIGFSFREERRFSSEDRAMMSALVQQCALALERIRLLEAERAARREAEDTAALLDALLANAPVGIAFFDRELRWQQINQALADMNGVPVEAHIGRTPREVVPDLADLAMPLFQGVLDTGEAVREIEIVGETPKAPGVTRTWLENFYPVPGQCGETVGIGVTVMEITDRKRAEEEVHRLNAELEGRVAERTRELLERTRQLEERNAEQETFLYTASHDLRAPLVSILGMAHVVEEALIRSDIDEASFALARVARNAERMSSLLQDLLAFARVGRVSEHSETLDLGEMTETVVADLSVQAARGGVRIEFPAGWPLVLMPRTEVTQVLLNLLSNAIKHAGRPGEEPAIRVGWELAGESVVVRVEDNGPGVPPQFREKVFRLFEKLQVGKEGTGVGLAIVKRIVERHGGRVWIEDSELGGAAFMVTLPTEKRPS